MIVGTVGPGGEILVVGAVRGLVGEISPLIERLEQFRPASVGLGISPDELAGLVEHFVDRPAEPLVSLTGTETAEVRGLAEYGEVRVPNPVTVGTVTWAQRHGIPVAGLDPSDADYADLFAEHISYLELVRRTLRERRLTGDPPRPKTADEFALAWHSAIGHGRRSQAFDRARDAELARGARALVTTARRVALVVDRERYDGVASALSAPSA